jgi:outer membrane protein assembly factor BamB
VGGPLVSSPAIAGGVVYIGSLDHHVYALEA